MPATTFVVVEGQEDIQVISTAAAWTPVWMPRSGGTDDAALLQSALVMQEMSTGDGFVWIAAEATVARSLRSYILDFASIHANGPRPPAIGSEARPTLTIVSKIL